MEDPMEAIVAQALTAAGVGFSRDLGGENPSGLDFRLSDGVEIEVKRFHTPRIADQMARAENVIAIQGKAAVEHYAALHTALAAKDEELAAVKAREAKLREVAEAFVATLTDNSRNEDRCLSFRHAELVDCISRARAELDKVKP